LFKSAVFDNVVSGEANFQMPSTSLTVGGFNQPPIARSLIEIQRNAEKGLSQRFMWFFPKPICGKFCDLQPLDEDFYDQLGMKMMNTGISLCIESA